MLSRVVIWIRANDVSSPSTSVNEKSLLANVRRVSSVVDAVPADDVGRSFAPLTVMTTSCEADWPFAVAVTVIVSVTWSPPSRASV